MSTPLSLRRLLTASAVAALLAIPAAPGFAQECPPNDDGSPLCEIDEDDDTEVGGDDETRDDTGDDTDVRGDDETRDDEGGTTDDDAEVLPLIDERDDDADAAPVVADAELAATGIDADQLGLLAAGAVALGAGAVVLGRRRRARSDA